MTVIINALTALDRSLENLEEAFLGQEQKMAAVGQQELFAGGAPPANGEANGNGHYMADPALLARKLDIAIERVEQVLREG